MIKVSKGCCGEEEMAQVKEAFDYGYFGLAFKVSEFEDEIKKYLGNDREVIAVNSGTSALHIALDSIGIEQGDEVILPSFTFVATAQAITSCRAKPVFCEVNADTMLMNIDDIEKSITPRTRAIIPVHYSGVSCDMDRLLELKEKYKLRIIEDAAHAFGSLFKGQKIGSLGDITCFSFDSIKVMTCGEGGAVVTGDKGLAEVVRKKRLLGIDRKSMHTKDWKKRAWFYDVPISGYRYHMSNINAAIGIAQIRKLEQFIAKRRMLCELYKKELEGVKEIRLPKSDTSTISPFMFVIKVGNDRRDSLKTYLMEHDIESGVSYIPCHHFSLYNYGQNLPVTDRIINEILCLPLHFELTEENVREISDCIKDYFNKNESI